MLFIKKIIGLILITTVLIGQLPADSLMYSHASEAELKQKIKEIKKQIRHEKSDKKYITKTLERIKSFKFFFCLQGLLFIISMA